MWGGKADHLSKKRQRFELQEPPRHPPTRLESQDQTGICGGKLCYSHIKVYNSNIKEAVASLIFELYIFI